MYNDQILDKEFVDWDSIYNEFEETYNPNNIYNNLDNDMLDNNNSNEDDSLNEDNNNFTEDDRDTAGDSTSECCPTVFMPAISTINIAAHLHTKHRVFKTKKWEPQSSTLTTV
ncbi:31008_t:CDS:2 [Racocetra persica]|uniref:31008_t:CDS:1 n=1 Tax=Racocetra persica TaxID=160502 RepID=A0ACA9Q8G4_9GLOM|nr:31008_t:CDS:2 [Racocetra persica]